MESSISGITNNRPQGYLDQTYTYKVTTTVENEQTKEIISFGIRAQGFTQPEANSLAAETSKISQELVVQYALEKLGRDIKEIKIKKEGQKIRWTVILKSGREISFVEYCKEKGVSQSKIADIESTFSKLAASLGYSYESETLTGKKGSQESYAYLPPRAYYLNDSLETLRSLSGDIRKIVQEDINELEDEKKQTAAEVLKNRIKKLINLTLQAMAKAKKLGLDPIIFSKILAKLYMNLSALESGEIEVSLVAVQTDGLEKALNDNTEKMKKVEAVEKG